jgi:hypothetical protein
MALGNTFAALTELNHFSASDTTFWAHYDEKDPPLRDDQPPYNRCMLLPLQAGDDDGPLRARAGLISDWLYQDLTSPLGRIADECRAGIAAPPSKSWSLVCQTFGMYRISWPKFAFLGHVARNLCQQLVADWMSKDAAPVREQVKAALAEEWNRLGLGGDLLLGRLQKTCEQELRQNPEEALTALLEPLTKLDAAGTDFAPAVQIMDQIDQLIGRPDDGSHTTALEEHLNAAADILSAGLAQKLGLFITGFIELSGSRLAGAEEAARQAIARLEQELQNHERLCKELAARADNAYGNIKALLASVHGNAPKSKRAAASVSTLIELIRLYPKCRYQRLLFQRVVNICVSLRGGLSDELREINYCRSRLTELLGNFQEPSVEATAEENGPWCRFLFPAGFRNVTDAAKQMLESITSEQLRGLDVRVQEFLQQQFEGLAHVCLASSNLLANLEEAMQREAEAFVEERLAGTGVADMYLAHYANEEEARDDLDAVYEAAAPGLLSAPAAPKGQFCILAAPPGPVGERFRDLARRALVDVETVSAASTNDIIFYREMPHVRLGDLEQLGPLGYEAYRQVITQKNLTPHSRADITEWRAAGG